METHRADRVRSNGFTLPEAQGAFQPIEKAKQMPDQLETCLSEAILTEIPHLRAYARLMTHDVSSADREVTETLKRALFDRELLCKCTSLQVQLLTILRNFLIDNERAPPKFERAAAVHERNGACRIASGGHGERLESFASALLCLNFEEREAVVFQAGVKLSAEDAARIIGCELHVYDARVRCGFAHLAELLPAEAPMTSAAALSGKECRDGKAGPTIALPSVSKVTIDMTRSVTVMAISPHIRGET
jgi:RNA polymerase sigma-70 factor (ECF subfamily)